jgi:hypothetical protein
VIVKITIPGRSIAAELDVCVEELAVEVGLEEVK